MAASAPSLSLSCQASRSSSASRLPCKVHIRVTTGSLRNRNADDHHSCDYLTCPLLVMADLWAVFMSIIQESRVLELELHARILVL